MTRRTAFVVGLSAALALAILGFMPSSRAGVRAQSAPCGIPGTKPCPPTPTQPPTATLAPPVVTQTPPTQTPPTQPPPTQVPTTASTQPPATQAPTTAPTQPPATQPPATATQPPPATATVALPSLHLNFGTPTPTQPPTAVATIATTPPVATATVAATPTPSPSPAATATATAAAARASATAPLAPPAPPLPAPTPAPAVAAVCFPALPAGQTLSVQVISGNDIPRRPGCQSDPPIAVTLATAPPSTVQASPGRTVQGAPRGGTTLTATLTNYTVDALSLQGTTVFDLGAGVQATNVSVTAGTAVIQGNQVVWNHFDLSSGEQASATISLVATSGSSVVAAGTPALSSVSVDAVDSQSGEQVVEQGGSAGPPISSLVSAAAPAGVTSPSLVLGVTSPAPGAALPAVAPAPASPATAAAGGAVTPPALLPTTGTGGLLSRSGADGAPAIWLTLLALALLAGGSVIGRRSTA